MRSRDTRPSAILAELGLVPERVTWLSSGLASTAWRVDGAGPTSVLRISAWPPDEQTTYRSEHALMDRLTAVGAPVPRPLTGDWQHPGLSVAPFSLTSFVEGAPLGPDPRPGTIEQLGSVIRTLHAIDATGYGPLVQEDHVAGGRTDPVTGLRERWSGLHAWLVDGTAITDHPAWAQERALLERASAHADAVVDAALGGPMALVHSDLHEENILEAEGGAISLVDFGETFRGAAAWEFAALAYFLGWSLADATLSAYLGDTVETGSWSAAAGLLALSFGLSRWEQDRSMGRDADEAHDATFLGETLDRL